MKFLKIISSSFHARTVREHTQLTGNPLGFFGHSQNFTSEEDIINLLKLNLEYENNIDPGYDRDILIVSSNSLAFKNGLSFLDSLQDTKIKRGKVMTMTRENIGYSFGAYNAGFQKYADQYDFYIFQEDDLISHHQDYLNIAHKAWIEKDSCGFVPFISASKASRGHRVAMNIKTNEVNHCHGGHGMSSNQVLTEVTKKYGALPHNKDLEQCYEEHLRQGEIMFTYSIKMLGYKFGELPKEIILVAPAFDLMRGLEIRKNPSTLEIVSHYFSIFIKKPIYNFFMKFAKGYEI